MTLGHTVYSPNLETHCWMDKFLFLILQQKINGIKVNFKMTLKLSPTPLESIGLSWGPAEARILKAVPLGSSCLQLALV